MQQSSPILLLAALAVLASSATAATIEAGKWYQIDLMTNTNATPGSNSVPSGAYFSPGLGPWTFNLLSAGTLEVTDAGLTGDYIRVLDGANPFLPNPQPPVVAPENCGLDPATCLANPNFWHMTVALNPKAYSLNFVGIDIGNIITSAFFRVTGTLGTVVPPPTDPTAVPEPTTYALTGTAVLALAWLKGRKR